MSHAPTHHEVLKLVKTGQLFLDHDRDGIRFYIRDQQANMTGRIFIRPDWNEGPDDRPGLMPVIESLEDKSTGFYEEGYEPSVERLWGIYEALRERLSPAKLFRRENGRWVLSHSFRPG